MAKHGMDNRGRMELDVSDRDRGVRLAGKSKLMLDESSISTTARFGFAQRSPLPWKQLADGERSDVMRK